MAQTNTIDRYFPKLKQDEAGVQNHGVKRTRQDDAGVREHSVKKSKQNGAGAGRHVVETTKKNKARPAITRVSRQLRAEALPIIFEKPIMLELQSPKVPGNWVQSVKKVIKLYGGKSGSPPSGTLRHVSGVHLSFGATPRSRRPGLLIRVDMLSSPKEMMKRQFCAFNKMTPVLIGKPGMDWTDASAVRAACDNAAISLEKQVANAISPHEARRFVMVHHIAADQRAALDAVCVLASACPWMTKVACIGDFSELVPREW